MPKIADNKGNYCIGNVSITNEDGTVRQGSVLVPCGAQHSPHQFETELPFRYQIFRERARLSPCCFWQPDSETNPEAEFKVNQSSASDVFIYEYKTFIPTTIPNIKLVDYAGNEVGEVQDPFKYVVGGWAHETSPSFMLKQDTLETVLISGSVPTRCKHPNATTYSQGQDGNPPCNGAKSLCPYYTGPKFKYVKDEQTAPGRPIMGQMVQELRSLIRDWRLSSQETWESTFEIPYIWARDFDDLPVAIAASTEDLEDFTEIPYYTLLTKIYWDINANDAVLSKIPSEYSSSSEEISGEAVEVPNFPTLVSKLGTAAIPYIDLYFPSSSPYTYICGENNGNRIYFAGKAPIGGYVYIVNSSLIGFPNIAESETDSLSVSLKIKELLVKSASVSEISGFKVSHADYSGFWEVTEGVALKSGTNVIYCFTKVDDTWFAKIVNVNFIDARCFFVQRSLDAFVPVPITQNLVTSIASLHCAGESLGGDSSRYLVFIGQGLPSTLSIGNAYHFYTFDRSYSRLATDDDVPNERFYRITSTTSTVVGTDIEIGDTNSREEIQLTWKKINNCNKLLVEITEHLIPGIPPAGMDRSWEPWSIKLEDKETKKVTIFKVSDGGRSTKGIIMPANVLIVEPDSDLDISYISPGSTLTIDLSVFSAFSDLGDDQSYYLLSLFSDDGFPDVVLGDVFTKPDAGDIVKESPHSIYSAGNLLIIPDSVKKYDMSYMVEFYYGGRVVSRKWVYGVGQVYQSWARDIDIRYSWGADQAFHALLPDYYAYGGGDRPRALATDAAALNQSNPYVIQGTKCGDHENSFRVGPVFSPYDDCDNPITEIDQYTIRITYRIPDAIKVDERYRGPDVLYPYIYRHNVAAYIQWPCIFEFSMGTFIRGESEWRGFGRVRGPISPNFNPAKYMWYVFNSWRMPQFGNIGREQIRQYFTIHFREYIYGDGQRPKVSTGWMPAHSYIESSSVFDSTYPSCFLHSSVTNFPLISEGDNAETWAGIDYLDLNNYKSIVAMYVPGDDIAGLSITSDMELALFTRKKFDEAIRVHFCRSLLVDAGTRYPQLGYYFMPRNDQVIWAHPEAFVGVVRDSSLNTGSTTLDVTNFISGAYLTNPQDSETGESSVSDRLNRPVNLGLEESQVSEEGASVEKYYNLKIKNPEYVSISGDLVINSYASIYIDEKLPVYFDRITGVLYDTKSPGSTYVEPYAATSISGIESSLSSKAGEGVEILEKINISPYFRFIDSNEAASFETISNRSVNPERFFIPGNLLQTTESEEGGASIQAFGYTIQSPEGPLDRTNFYWNVFIPAVNISRINTKYLPKIYLNVLDSSEGVGDVPNEIAITTTSFPSLDWNTREALQGRDLDTTTFPILRRDGEASSSILEWYPLSLEDLKTTVSGIDKRKGQIGAIAISIKFARPIELAKMRFSAEIYAKQITDFSGITDTGLPLSMVPSVKIYATNMITLEEEILFETERLTFTRTNSPGKQAKIEVSKSYEEGTMETVYVNEVRVDIGSRDNYTGFRILGLTLGELILNEEATEAFGFLEQKYYLTAGYYNQHSNEDARLTGDSIRPDISDSLETAGICEFWRSPEYDVESKMTGKLRSNYTSTFYSYDIEKEEFNVSPIGDEVTAEGVILYETAALLEERQKRILSDLRDKISYHFATRSFKFYANPSDIWFFGSWGGQNLATYCVNSRFSSGILWGEDYTSWDEYISNAVSPAKKPPGWQDAGFSACLGAEDKNKFYSAKCAMSFGAGGSGLVARAHTTCRNGIQHGNTRLFETVTFPDAMYGSGVAGALVRNAVEEATTTSAVNDAAARKRAAEDFAAGNHKWYTK